MRLLFLVFLHTHGGFLLAGFVERIRGKQANNGHLLMSPAHLFCISHYACDYTLKDANTK